MALRFPIERRAFLAGVGATLLAAPSIHAATPVTIFAAASLKGPLDVIAPDARLVYGGSGGLARQVAQGAPADIVILAATDWVEWLRDQGVIGQSLPVARNALVLAGGEGAAPLDLTPDALDARLGTGRLAMGDPISVPAGRYAQQAFETLGLWGTVSPKVLLAENVRAALAFVARGDVPLAAVYRSDLRLPGLSEVAAVPPTSHAPIIYPAALTRRADRAAEVLLSRIAASADVFASHGFRPA